MLASRSRASKALTRATIAHIILVMIPAALLLAWGFGWYLYLAWRSP